MLTVGYMDVVIFTLKFFPFLYKKNLPLTCKTNETLFFLFLPIEKKFPSL